MKSELLRGQAGAKVKEEVSSARRRKNRCGSFWTSLFFLFQKTIYEVVTILDKVIQRQSQLNFGHIREYVHVSV